VLLRPLSHLLLVVDTGLLPLLRHPVRACSHRFPESKCRRVLIWPTENLVVVRHNIALQASSNNRRNPRVLALAPTTLSLCSFSTGGSLTKHAAPHHLPRPKACLSPHILRCYEDHHHHHLANTAPLGPESVWCSSVAISSSPRNLCEPV
jgi:hypothetical protein